MKKYFVEFGSGEARYEGVVNGSGREELYRPYNYCDYMAVNIDDEYVWKRNQYGHDNLSPLQLYSQVNPNDYGFCDGTVDGWDEQSAYDDLKEMIIKQAKKNGINPESLAFYYG